MARTPLKVVVDFPGKPCPSPEETLIKAYQEIIEALAQSVQDAASNLKAVNYSSAATIRTALNQYMETKDPSAVKAIDIAMKASLDAAGLLNVVTENAMNVIGPRLPD